MTVKHSPHPWRAKELSTYQQPGWIVLWPDKGGAHMRRLDYHGCFTEQDARLIAAAPEMLAALKVAAMWSDSDWVGYEAVTAAIAKATGDTA